MATRKRTDTKKAGGKGRETGDTKRSGGNRGGRARSQSVPNTEELPLESGVRPLESGESPPVVQSGRFKPERRCTAKSKRSGQRCGRYAIKGATVCPSHGGATTRSRNAAKRRTILENAMKEAVGGNLAGTNLSPVEHLLNALYWSMSVAIALSQAVTESGAKPGDSLYATWERERDRHARIAKLCADAGVDAKRVALEADRAELFASVIRRILSELGVSLEEPETMRVVSRNLVALTGPGGEV
jgi:hypothetical protein